MPAAQHHKCQLSFPPSASRVSHVSMIRQAAQKWLPLSSVSVASKYIYKICQSHTHLVSVWFIALFLLCWYLSHLSFSGDSWNLDIPSTSRVKVEKKLPADHQMRTGACQNAVIHTPGVEPGSIAAITSDFPLKLPLYNTDRDLTIAIPQMGRKLLYKV